MGRRPSRVPPSPIGWTLKAGAHGRCCQIVRMDCQFGSDKLLSVWARPDSSCCIRANSAAGFPLHAIEPVGLGAPRPPVDFDAGSVDNDVVRAQYSVSQR